MSPLERVRRSFGAVAALDREHLRVGPFDVFVDHLRESRFHSLAMPDPGAPDADLAAALPGLRDAFATRGRTARTEFLEALTPGLEALLLADGWVLSERMPLMVCTPGRFVAPPTVDGLVVESLGGFSPPERIVAFLETQRAVFEDTSPITDEEIVRWRKNASTAYHAVGSIDGAVAGTAFASRVLDGVSEIGGVATPEPFRGRGIAAATTAAVVQAAFAGGAELAWLTAAGESAQGVYARMGFAAQGTLLAYDAG